MTLFEKHMVTYMMYEEQRLENDVIQLDNNVMYRKADPIDHLEMIMAQTRLATAQRIFKNIWGMLHDTREIER